MTDIKEIKPSDEFYLEVYENDYKTSKDRIRDALQKRVYCEGYDSIEQFAAEFVVKVMMKEKGPTKSDEIILKYLRFIGETEGWTSASKEFTINSNIPKLNDKTLLSY